MTPTRLATIQANHVKHVANLRTIWNQSLHQWLDGTNRTNKFTGKPVRNARNFSRSRYVPREEDLKHERASFDLFENMP